MKIVFVLRSIANAGGIERTFIDKANYMAEEGHHVFFVTYEQGLHKCAFDLNSKIRSFDLDCRKFTLYRYPLYKRLYKTWRMKKQMRIRWNAFVDEHHPDIVVTTTYSSDFMSELMSVCEKTHVVVESHTAFTHDMLPDIFIKRIQQRLLLRVLKRCSLLISLTDGDKQCWEKYIKNVRKVTNPVSFYVENIDNVKKEQGRIICVGRLHEQKRFDRLINAFAMIAENNPGWYVVIYGKGNLQSVLERQISALGLDGRISIHEPTHNIMQEYLKSELFVLCSDYEGLPLVLLEAMACGVPSIATDCPFGPADIIEDQKTGLLCKMNEKDLADKIEWMITHEKERNEIGANGHKAAAQYKKEFVMKEWERAYLSVL